MLHYGGVLNFKKALKNQGTCYYLPRIPYEYTIDSYGVTNVMSHLYSLALSDNRVVNTVVLTDVRNWISGDFKLEDHCESRDVLLDEYILLDDIHGRKYKFIPNAYKRIIYNEKEAK